MSIISKVKTPTNAAYVLLIVVNLLGILSIMAAHKHGPRWDAINRFLDVVFFTERK